MPQLNATIILAFLLIGGCNKTADQPLPAKGTIGASGGERAVGVSTGSYGFTPDGVVPGVDYACVHYATNETGDIAYLLWTDLGGLAKFEGSAKGGTISVSDPENQVSFSVSDEIETLQIGGQQFSLEAGALFLVSAGSKSRKIRQVKSDLSRLGQKPSRAEFQQLAESNISTLKEFYGGAQVER